MPYAHNPDSLRFKATLYELLPICPNLGKPKIYPHLYYVLGFCRFSKRKAPFSPPDRTNPWCPCATLEKIRLNGWRSNLELGWPDNVLHQLNYNGRVFRRPHSCGATSDNRYWKRVNKKKPSQRPALPTKVTHQTNVQYTPVKIELEPVFPLSIPLFRFRSVQFRQFYSQN